MSLISKLTPINLDAEKQRFFELNFRYNPQFQYSESIKLNWLTKYGLPETKLIQLANKVVKLAYKTYNYMELNRPKSKILTPDQVYKLTKRFLKIHQLNKRFQIVIDRNISSKAAVTGKLIKFYPNVKFDHESLLGTLYHEIGTHVLRRINYEKQPWYKRKKQYGLTHNYLKTEEGLAVIHGYLPRQNKLMHRSALKYLAVEQAQKTSFRELFVWVNQYLNDPQQSWRSCVRLKRGLIDTSQPGGFTKDLLYFAGFVKVWQWLKKHQFDPTELYYGKVAIEDLELVKKLQPHYQPILPSFYIVDKKKYTQQLREMGQVNFLE